VITTSRVASLVRGMITSKARPLNIIERDALELGIKVGICDKRFLSRYSDKQYDSLFLRLSLFKKHWDFSRILVDPAHLIKNFDFSSLPDDFLVSRIEGATLNLIHLKTSYSKYLDNRIKQSPPGIYHPGFKTDNSIGPEAAVVEFVKAAEEKGLVDTGRPFNSKRLLSPKLSRLISYLSYGRLVEAEIVDEPMKSAGHLQGTIFSLINEIGVQSWGGFPPDFARERLMDVTKAVIVKVDGENAAYSSAKTISANGKDIRWFEIALTKPEFQKIGLQTRSFYWLFKEAYLEELAKFVSTLGRFRAINFLKALPKLIKALLYVFGFIKNPPPHIAEIKVPVAFLAVQPVSIGPFYEYVDDIYPNVKNSDAEPDSEKKMIARAVLPSGARMDEKNFVVEGDYEGIEHLILDPTKPPGEGGVLDYKDEKVNKMMWKRLGYNDRAGRDQMVIMNVDLAAFRKYFEVQRNKRNKERTVKTALRITKDI